MCFGSLSLGRFYFIYSHLWRFDLALVGYSIPSFMAACLRLCFSIFTSSVNVCRIAVTSWWYFRFPQIESSTCFFVWFSLQKVVVQTSECINVKFKITRFNINFWHVLTTKRSTATSKDSREKKIAMFYHQNAYLYFLFAEADCALFMRCSFHSL